MNTDDSTFSNRVGNSGQEGMSQVNALKAIKVKVSLTPASR
jgi:hypothetical protein